MFQIYSEKKDCTGCSACASFCKNIKMTMDEEGFRYPVIDQSKCSDCGQCRQICPMTVGNRPVIRQYPGPDDLLKISQLEYPQVFAAWNKDKAVRQESSSGGIFSLLAKQVIAVDGLVVGAGLTDDLQLRHFFVDSMEGLQGLRGSKYLQSEMGAVFREIETALKECRQVFFTGTPCQVAGLKSFLKQTHENLMTCDIVCHGVPSDKLFRKYIKECEVQHGGKAVTISFRNKKPGWKHYSIKIDFENGDVSETAMENDSFMRLFLSDLSLRPSCHACPFATIPRQGDISLADYWGVGTAHPGIDDDQGISLILVNTEKGRERFQQLEGEMIVHPSDLVRAVACNPCVIHPVPLKPERQDFMQDIDRLPLKELIKKYIRKPSWICSRYSASGKLFSGFKERAANFFTQENV